jgi:2-C-methyl-D-erythritol 4-phosphate cytidylyltransferase
MQQDGATWGIVLAGGEGRRLQSLTRDGQGRVVPKQFCSFLGTQSLLRSAIDRLATAVDRRRIIVVVAASHRFHVLPVPPCGWADLGTPERVTECARRWSCLHAEDCDVTDGVARPAAPVNLARAVAGLQRLDALSS